MSVDRPVQVTTKLEVPITRDMQLFRGASGVAPLAAQGFTQTWSGDTNSSIVIARPGGTVEGDLLIAAVGQDYGAAANSFNTPAGWTVVRQDYNGLPWGNGVYSALMWKIAGEAEPGDYTFTHGNNPSRKYGTIHRIAGAHPVSPIGQVTHAYNSSDSTVWNHAALTAAGPSRLGMSIQHISMGGAGANVLSMTHDTPGWESQLVAQPHTFYGYGFGFFADLPESAQACQITRSQHGGAQVANLYLLEIVPAG